MLPSDRPLQSPHLPQSRVTSVAISETAGESIKKLESLGIQCIPISAHPDLPAEISSHADLQMFHMELFDIFVDEHLFGVSPDKRFEFRIIPEKLQNTYPGDVRLNAVRLGNRLICNPKTVSQAVLESAHKHKLEIVHVNQGYTKCSICCLTEDVIITDDPGIYKSAQFFCSDRLLVSKGSIRLSAAHYGLISGCCGKLDRNLIGWNGRIEPHSDAEEILAFLKKHHMESINLNDGPLTDIGGILPLTEEITTL